MTQEWEAHEAELSEGFVAEVYEGDDLLCQIKQSGPQAMQKANLISAAKELLLCAECELAMDMPWKAGEEIFRNYGWTPESGRMGEWLEEKRTAAISKAKGA